MEGLDIVHVGKLQLPLQVREALRAILDFEERCKRRPYTFPGSYLPHPTEVSSMRR